MNSSNTPRRAGPPPLPTKQRWPDELPAQQQANSTRGNLAAVACAAIAGICIMLLGSVAVFRLTMPLRQAAETTVEAAPESDSQPSTAAANDVSEEARAALEADKKEEADRRQEELEQEKRKIRDAEIAEAERRRKEAEDMAAATRAREAEAAQNQKPLRDKAFAQFLALPRIIPSDIPPSSSEPLPITLGPLDAEHLDGLQFEIAAPKERFGGPVFKAWVEQDARDKLKWLVLTRTATDGESTALTLATISVADSALLLRPGKLPPGLRALLRRSVLLAKATTPAETDKPVIRAIQLLVPTQTPAPFIEPLGGMHERHEEIKLAPPSGITVSPSGTNEAPKLPIDDSVVEYTIAFPYDRKGIKKPATHENTLLKHGQGAYCDLLEQLLPSDPKTTIGLFVELSQRNGLLTVQTKAEGPGAENIDSKKLSEWAGRTDRAQDKYAKDVITLVKQFVSKLMKSTPADYERTAQPALENLVTLQSNMRFRDYEGDFGSFFVREKRFTTLVDDPNQKGKKVPQVVTDPDECLRMWDERCKQILSSDQHAAQKKDNAEWKKEFVDVIKDWAADWEPRFVEYAESFRRYSRPLAEDVTVTVTRITSKAYAEDGVEYTVILSTPAGKPGQDDHSLARDID